MTIIVRVSSPSEVSRRHAQTDEVTKSSFIRMNFFLNFLLDTCTVNEIVYDNNCKGFLSCEVSRRHAQTDEVTKSSFIRMNFFLNFLLDTCTVNEIVYDNNCKGFLSL